MTYKVIRTFKDGQSEGLCVYREGDTFPRGYVVTDERIAELSGSDNVIGMPLIVSVGGFEPEPIVEEVVKPVKRRRTKKAVGQTVEKEE